MDETTVVAGQIYNERLIAHAKSKGETAHSFTVVVLGHEDNTPFSITATSREDLINQLDGQGHDISKNWGAGRIFGGDMVSDFGPSDEAKTLIENYLLGR